VLLLVRACFAFDGSCCLWGSSCGRWDFCFCPFDGVVGFWVRLFRCWMGLLVFGWRWLVVGYLFVRCLVELLVLAGVVGRGVPRLLFGSSFCFAGLSFFVFYLSCWFWDCSSGFGPLDLFLGWSCFSVLACVCCFLRFFVCFLIDCCFVFVTSRVEFCLLLVGVVGLGVPEFLGSRLRVLFPAFFCLFPD